MQLIFFCKNVIGLTLLGSVITGKVPALSKNRVMKAFRREKHCRSPVYVLNGCFIFNFGGVTASRKSPGRQLVRSVVMKRNFPSLCLEIKFRPLVIRPMLSWFIY
jgi:hypothetical protein